MGQIEMSGANMEEYQNVAPLTAHLEEHFSYSSAAAPRHGPLKQISKTKVQEFSDLEGQ